MIKVTACVERQETGEQEIPVADIVCGDLIHLSAGDIIPADLRISECTGPVYLPGCLDRRECTGGENAGSSVIRRKMSWTAAILPLWARPY
jgi:hypothetical protein